MTDIPWVDVYADSIALACLD